MTNESEIEAEIQATGKTAPRLTPDAIDATIVSEMYHVFPGTTLTICALTLRNGTSSPEKAPPPARRTSTPTSAGRLPVTTLATRSGALKATFCVSA